MKIIVIIGWSLHVSMDAWSIQYRRAKRRWLGLYVSNAGGNSQIYEYESWDFDPAPPVYGSKPHVPHLSHTNWILTSYLSRTAQNAKSVCSAIYLQPPCQYYPRCDEATQ